MLASSGLRLRAHAAPFDQEGFVRRVTIISDQFTTSVVLVGPPYPKLGDEVTGHLCGVPVKGVVSSVKKETGFIIPSPGRTDKSPTKPGSRRRLKQ